MGNCIYCGKPAGLLMYRHRECYQEHKEKLKEISYHKQRLAQDALRAIKGELGYNELENEIEDFEKAFRDPESKRKDILINAFETSVERFLEDDILDEKEEKRLDEFKEHFSLSQEDLDKKGAMTKTAKAAVLRDVMNGLIPEHYIIDGDIQINLQKGEKIVWAFKSDYLEDKKSREYVGRSQSIGFRPMKGVYLRTGVFKGHPVEQTERVQVDDGYVFITNKNIYFAGHKKRFRIPYAKVVSFIPFSDGFGLVRDASNAKPQIFITGDGWFSYNLVINLAHF